MVRIVPPLQKGNPDPISEFAPLPDPINVKVVEPGIGLYCLFAGMSDRAEAVESLKATTVWQTGLKNVTQLLSNNQLQDFRSGKPIQAESVVRGLPLSHFCPQVQEH